jgi:hypothetical protein
MVAQNMQFLITATCDKCGAQRDGLFDYRPKSPERRAFFERMGWHCRQGGGELCRKCKNTVSGRWWIDLLK